MLVRPYAALLRDNPHFARLWYAQIVSLLGDWFNTIVLSALVAAYSDDSGLAISLLLLARFLPPLLVGPAAGVLLDRFDRRRLLIASDLLRTVIVLGFLLADRPDRLWLIYALTVAQFSLSALFEPGRSALTPRLVRSGQLTEANILGTMTWSVILAVGGVLGGVISTLFGTQIALVFDASTFLLSAWLISLIPPALGKVQPQASGEPGNGVSPPSLRDFTDGVRYAADHPETGAVLLVKLGGSVGSLDALLIIYATTYFVLGEGGSLSLGLLWTAFGLGAVMGPLVAASASDGTVRTMRRWIIGAYGFIFAGWIVFGAAPSLLTACAGIFIKAIGSNIYWTYSSVILQKSIPDRYLGRLMSLDLAGFQLATVISIVVTGAALEAWGSEQARALVFATAAASLAPLILWALTVRWIERRETVVSDSVIDPA